MIDVNADSRRIRELLGEYKHNVFPLVDSLQSRILIGSITRSEMSKSLEMSMTRPLESASVNPGMGINIENYSELMPFGERLFFYSQKSASNGIR